MWNVKSEDQDIHNFKILLVYANSPMSNLIPVSISSLAGSLNRRGFIVKLFDTTFYPWTNDAGGERKGTLHVSDFDYDTVGIKFYESDVFKDFRNLVNNYAPNLIALSTVEPTHEFGIELLSFVRDKKIPTIVGGVHTIFSPEEVIVANSVNMVCVGEGEKCLVELCEKMAKGEPHHNIDNLWIKADMGVIKNKKSLINLDELPDLDFSIFDEKRFYRPMAGHMYKMIPVEFSRGCIYKCTYCSAPAYAEKFKDCGKWFRDKSVAHIIREINDYIERYDIEYFYFVSETFLAMSSKRFFDFCQEYKKISIPFWFNTRPETITPEKVKMLEEIGCHRMSIGVESGNEEYRKKMLKRDISNERIVEACNIVSASNIQLSVNNIVGFPDETRAMMFDTINLNRKIDADSYSCSIFQPYRGTLLHKYCVEKGYIDPKKLAIDLTVTSPLSQPFITGDEIKGIARTFPLYVKFPENEFELIKPAEKFDNDGTRIFLELSKIFREKYVKKR